LLAILRILIVRWTVPLEDSTTVEALVRCKSIHLSLSDYARTMMPVGTPVTERNVRRLVLLDDEAGSPITPFMMPDLTSPQDLRQQEERYNNYHGNDGVGMHWDESEHEDGLHSSLISPIPVVSPPINVVENDTDDNHDDSDNDKSHPELVCALAGQQEQQQAPITPS
jgi:hypothetical protein